MEARSDSRGHPAYFFLAVSLLAVIWEGAVRVFSPAAFLLPGPSQVLVTFGRNADYLLSHAFLTLGEMLAGLLAGCIAGAAVAISMARWNWSRNFLLPTIVLTQTLPVFAIAPILVIWFGYGAGSKIVMAALIIFFPIASAFYDGLVSVDRQWTDLAHSWGARPGQVLLRIRVPAALPSLASGCKIAATLAPIGAVVGEWAGASGGLGYVMLQANARMETDLVFASLILLAVMAFLLRRTVVLAADRLIPWQTRTK